MSEATTAYGYGKESESTARRVVRKTEVTPRERNAASRSVTERAVTPAAQKAASRRPDMSHPVSRVEKPNVVIGSVPKQPAAKEKKKTISLVLPVTEPNVRTVTGTDKRVFPLSTILCIALCFGLFMYVILDYVRINECSVRLDQIQQQITEAGKLEQELSLEYEKRNDLNEIARLAEEELGMVKLDEIKKVHLNTQNEDRIELTEAAKKDTTEVSLFSEMMSAIRQIYSRLNEYSE